MSYVFTKFSVVFRLVLVFLRGLFFDYDVAVLSLNIIEHSSTLALNTHYYVLRHNNEYLPTDLIAVVRSLYIYT